ncbi:MAG: TolB family protein [Actinomycetota bacterium]
MGVAAIAALALAWSLVPTATPTAEAAFPGRNGRIVFSAGRYVDPSGGRTPPGYAQVRDYDIFSIASDGSGLQQLTQGSAIDGMPAWSADGRKIAFIRAGQDTQFEFDILVMDAYGSSLINLSQTPLYREWEPSWSPDGSKILFQSDRAMPQVIGRVAWDFFDCDLFVMNADGSDVVQITEGPGCQASATWSPDGRWIAFYDPAADAISLIRPDGSDRHVLSTDTYRAAAPDWSPDSSSLAFFRRGARHVDVWVINVKTGRLNKLTNDSAVDRWPNWSPDGRYISFVSNRDGSYGLYRMNVDGSHVQSLVDLELPSDSPLDWGPRV